MADIMVQHLVRWVSSQDSFLYDRSLHQYVQVMSRKALQQLMGDFRRVGSNVIFASATRLLLQTTKTEVSSAYAYSKYILKSIKAKPLFHFVDLEVTEYWDYLIWYDAFNYGGKACREVVAAESQSLDCIMHWQMSTFLPVSVRSTFHDWVVEFIETLHKRHRVHPPATEDTSITRLTQLPAIALGSDGEQGTFLQASFGKPLKRQIAGLIRRQRDEMRHPDLAVDWVFPILPGSHLDLTNPTLQLAKSLMQVLSLDQGIMLQSRMLRKELLAMFDIREFSPSAKFTNPSQSLRLGRVLCDACTVARDLDLCREDDLSPGGVWRCHSCGHDLDRLRIEERLIADVQRMAVEWSTQDIKCVKCARVRINDFMEHCSCSGEWATMLAKDEVVGQLGVFRAAADFYGLRMLKDAVTGVMSVW
ncbi:MAG: DNA polymerase epsilon catalytic subunit [Phylliscum demangeonii]|nr:MAG: DNA polymerase epsilon catalytic subunit [Phylliscum demangeonii]